MTWQEELESLIREGTGLRSENQLLTSICQLLEELLAEVKRGNSIAREGAVSSVEVKFLANGTPQPVVKAYAGSEPPVVEAIEAYARTVLLAQQGVVDGWGATVDDLERRRA